MNIIENKNLTTSKMSNESEIIDHGDIVLKEFIDKNRLLWLLSNLEKDDKNLSKLKNIKKSLIFDNKKSCWFHNVNYSKNEHGRLFAKGASLQNVSSMIRNTLIFNICLDIDIKNASYSLLLEDAKKNNISLKYVEEYYFNRDEKLKEIMEFYNVSRSNAKELFIYCISCVEKNNKKKYNVFNAWKLQNKLNKSNLKIESFINNLFNEICNYASIVQKPDSVTFLNYIFDLEINILLYIKKLLPNYKTCFNTLIHDGGLILKNENTNDNMINEINNKLKEDYKYVEICFKPFENYYEIDDNLNNNNTDYLDSIDKLIKNVVIFSNTGSVAELFKERYSSFIKSTGCKKERAFFIYENHRWVLDKSGEVYIRKYIKLINNDLKDIQKELFDVLNKDNGNEKLEKFKQELDKTISKLDSNTFIKQSIEHISAEIYEDDFFDKLDINPYLLGFDNGVYDLEKNEFRDGRPEDLVSFTTGYDYTDCNDEDYTLLNKLIEQILYIEDERTFYLKMLSTMLLGKNIQGLFINIGNGANGKSLIASILFKALGNYICKVNNTIISDAIKTGANPEIANINKKRGVIIQEPNKKMKLNISTIKELTGGAGEIKARKLFSNNDDVINFGTYFVESNDYLTFDGEFKNDMARRINNIKFRSTYITDINKVDEENHIYLANSKYENAEWIDKMKMPLMKILLNYFQEFKKDDYKIIRSETIENNNNEYVSNSTDFDKLINDIIEKSDDKSDYVKVLDLYNNNKDKFYKNCNIKVKKDFIQIIEKHPIYGPNYRIKSNGIRHIIRGFKYIDDESNESDEE